MGADLAFDQSMKHEGSSLDDDKQDLYLIFRLNHEAFAIPIEYVREIVCLQSITAVPDLPRFYKGIINLRGRVISVMDLCCRLNLEERGYTDRTCIVVVRVEEQTVGLIVEEIREVHYLPPTDIELPSGSMMKETGFVTGIGKSEKEVKIILDVKALLG